MTVMAAENNTPGWDQDLTGAYVRVFPAELFDGPITVTVGGEEVISVTATVGSIGVDKKTLRPVLYVSLHDDNGTDARVSPYNVELLGFE